MGFHGLPWHLNGIWWDFSWKNRINNGNRWENIGESSLNEGFLSHGYPQISSKLVIGPFYYRNSWRLGDPHVRKPPWSCLEKPPFPGWCTGDMRIKTYETHLNIGILMNIIYFPENSPFIDNVHIKTSIHIHLYIGYSLLPCLMTPEGISIKSHQIKIKSQYKLDVFSTIRSDPISIPCWFTIECVNGLV